MLSTQMSTKEKGLYYLFPGQGKGKRKRFAQHLLAAFIVGLITAGLLAGLFYFLQK
jgi:hypothetical protein